MKRHNNSINSIITNSKINFHILHRKGNNNNQTLCQYITEDFVQKIKIKKKLTYYSDTQPMTNEMCFFDKGLRRCEVCALPIRELLNRFLHCCRVFVRYSRREGNHTHHIIHNQCDRFCAMKKKEVVYYREDILFLSMHCVCAYMNVYT